ncbi:Uncharacterised protein [Clostridioides difficile]|uniref:hypothetical protein n=1 Tax=Clostridioides difficile TaxID=1496 RepID=UPI00097FF2E4|nr:hypothetical protein [Clostridioides difficile]SJQ02793.1 Uncharacterised protein [Clostridioides difficile]
MKIPKKIAAMLTVTMIAGSSTAGIASAQTVATNLTGQERYETAVELPAIIVTVSIAAIFFGIFILFSSPLSI